MSRKTKKGTFNLPPDVLAGLDKGMAEGVAPSKNALVERALVKELKELRRRARNARWEEGARDPALLKDISEVEVLALALFSRIQPEFAGSLGSLT